MKWIFMSIVALILSFCIFSYLYNSQQNYNQILSKRIDSLRNELYINKMELFRYEVTMEYLQELDSSMYKDLQQFHDYDTE
jgi:hypothetical protein